MSENEAASKTIPEPERVKLWVRAGGRCEICNKYLLEDEFTEQPVRLAELAHNVGRQKAKGSPRGLAPLSIDERNKAENLLLLCGDHHRVIDARVTAGDYTVEELDQLKRRHEDRIRFLTALGEDAETVVVRVIGDIRGASVELSRATTRGALHAANRYPRYDLAVRGADIELDLRAIPGEGTPDYWQEGRRQIDALVSRIQAGVDENAIRHLSVFAAARIPLLIYLGARLDDKVPTHVYQKQRGGDESWHWDDSAPSCSFESRLIRHGALGRVVLLVSISGTIAVDDLPTEIGDEAAIYAIEPSDGAAATPDVLRSRASVDAFAATYRAFLAQIERDHAQLAAIELFAAVPLAGAIALGRSRMKDVHPPLRVYDRDENGGYTLALEID